MICNTMVEETGYSHRYVDIVLVKFGHRKVDMDTGIIEGICLQDNPKCSQCLLLSQCSYAKEGNKSVEQINLPKKLAAHNVRDSKFKEEKNNESQSFKEFFKSERFKSCSINAQALIKYLLYRLDNLNVDFGIKERRDAIALTLGWDKTKNIATIWICRDHIKVLVLGDEKRKCFLIVDIDNVLMNKIKNKYLQICSA